MLNKLAITFLRMKNDPASRLAAAVPQLGNMLETQAHLYSQEELQCLMAYGQYLMRLVTMIQDGTHESGLGDQNTLNVVQRVIASEKLEGRKISDMMLLQCLLQDDFPLWIELMQGMADELGYQGIE